jgi:hypothetical protein
MIALQERSAPPPAGCKRALLALSLILVASAGCTDDGNGSADAGPGDTGGTTGATGATATGTTGENETGSTGGTGTTNGTGATGETGDDLPPEFEITLASDCSLLENTGSFGGPYLLVFAIDLENIGGPYDASTLAIFTEGLPPLSGNGDTTVGYDDVIEGVNIRHDLEASALGKSGIVEIRAPGETRGLSVSVSDALGPADCHLT